MSIQCDWISASIVSCNPHIYDTGTMLKLDGFGNVISQCRTACMVGDDEPSSSSSVRVHSRDDRSLYISGNPCKLFQKHNLWGSADILGLFLEAGLWVRDKAGLFPGSETYKANGFSVPALSRVDLTRSYRFGSHQEAQDFIRWVAGCSRSRHGAARLYGSETAYFGQKSTRWTMKVYDKASEVKKTLSRLGILYHTPEFLEWVEGVVRFEVTLRTPELKKSPHILTSSPDDLLSIWTSYYDRIEWTENAMTLSDEDLLRVPLKLRAVLASWESGRDLRALYPHNTFYRHRRGILDTLGIDIAVPPPPSSDKPENSPARALDPKGWDPEPLLPVFTPREELKSSYGLI